MTFVNKPFSELPASADLRTPGWSWVFVRGSTEGALRHYDPESETITSYDLPPAVNQLVVAVRTDAVQNFQAELRRMLGVQS